MKFWLLIIAACLCRPTSIRAQVQSAWSADADMRLFFEVIQAIRRRSLVAVDPQRMVTDAIEHVIKSTDDYARYESPEEVAAAKTRQETMQGVGVRALKTVDERWLLLPLPEGPAEASGIVYGDELVALDGHPVRPANDETAKKLRDLIADPNRPVKRFEVLRSGLRVNLPVFATTFATKTVSRDRAGPDARFGVVRVTGFDTQTVRDLRVAVSRASAVNRPLVLDLRSNEGGDLNEAIKAARLFLPAEKSVVTIERREDRDAYHTEESGPFAVEPRLYLYQDRQTASAAEVFIGALVKNGRAQSIGLKTYGKGVTQEVVPLSNNGRLIVTNGRLLLPDGTAYDRYGLSPTRAVLDDSPEQWDVELQLMLDTGNP